MSQLILSFLLSLLALTCLAQQDGGGGRFRPEVIGGIRGNRDQFWTTTTTTTTTTSTMATTSTTTAAPVDPDGDPIPPPPIDDLLKDHPLPVQIFVLPVAAKQNIRDRCRNRRCRGQQDIFSRRRSGLKDMRSRSFQKGNGFGGGGPPQQSRGGGGGGPSDRGGGPGGLSVFRRRPRPKPEADELVEANFQKTFRVKQRYYKLYGIDDVADPSDDGLIADDMLLNEQQLDSLLETADVIQEALTELTRTANNVASPATNLVDDQGSTTDDILTRTILKKRRRRKRSGTYFEDAHFAVQYWTTMPIPYMFDTGSKFNIDQKNDIRRALGEITTKTGSVISFQEINSPIDAPYLEYVLSTNPGICGASTVGMQTSDNNVYVNFNCGGYYGSILHETMHALGAAHHHARLDRNDWLNINWNNVDAACVDSFSIDDMNQFTTYGVTYSYGSVMHYASTACAINKNVATLTAKKSLNGATMGQRTQLAQADVDLLLRMYCCRGTQPGKCACRDSSVYCGYDANIGYCTDTRYKSWMAKNCIKSCGMCKCPAASSG